MAPEPEQRWHPASLSVVVPFFDEEGNAAPLVHGVVAAVRPLQLPFEIVVVDDGSRDAPVAVLRGLLPEIPELRRNVLLAQVVGTIQAPISSFVRILNLLIVRLLYVLKRIEEKKAQS